MPTPVTIAAPASIGKRRLALVLGGLGVLLALQLAFAPWVFFIGGRFSPIPRWHGYGALGTDRDLSAVLVYLDVGYAPPGGTSTDTSDLEGGALVCERDGRTQAWDARLETALTWLRLDGRKTNLHLVRTQGRYPDGSARHLLVDLPGSWVKGGLQLWAPHGLAEFHPEQRALDPGPAPASITLAYASKDDFLRACAGLHAAPADRR